MELDESVTPVIQSVHRVPITQHSKLKKALTKLDAEGVIEDADGLSEWVSNLVISQKYNGQLRLCLNPKPLNHAIKREPYIIPTAEEVQAQLADKRIFTVIGIKEANRHVRLTERSSRLCTFHTPWGRKRFKCMPFGITSAGKVLQKRLQDVFGDIEGCHVIADDLIIAGNDEADHDKVIRAVMKRATDNNGKHHHRSRSSIRSCQSPSDCGLSTPEGQRWPSQISGDGEILDKLIAGESELSAPLPGFMKEDVPWEWHPEHDDAMQKIKDKLISAPTLSFYDVNDSVKIQADASQNGWGVCLLQECKPVAFASRALTPAEQNCAQLEKELLSVSFACAKFQQYIYGKTVEIQNNHKPL